MPDADKHRSTFFFEENFGKERHRRKGCSSTHPSSVVVHSSTGLWVNQGCSSIYIGLSLGIKPSLFNPQYLAPIILILFQSMHKKDTWPVWRSLIGLHPLCYLSLGLDFLYTTCTGTCDAPAPLNSSLLIYYLSISLFLFLSLFPITFLPFLPRKTIDTLNKGILNNMINRHR